MAMHNFPQRLTRLFTTWAESREKSWVLMQENNKTIDANIFRNDWHDSSRHEQKVVRSRGCRCRKTAWMSMQETASIFKFA